MVVSHNHPRPTTKMAVVDAVGKRAAGVKLNSLSGPVDRAATYVTLAQAGGNEGTQEDEPETGEEEDSNDQGDREGAGARHIHPCVCDMSEVSKKKVAAFERKQAESLRKFVERKQEIEDEIARIEEEKLEMERAIKEQEELFSDEYEMVGHRMKRKKRSARRASMVSLGVKQVINYRKEPRIKPHMNKVYDLRKQYTMYCGKHEFLMPPIVEVDFRKLPTIPVKQTIYTEWRHAKSKEKRMALIEAEDTRPRFIYKSTNVVPSVLDMGWPSQG